MNFHALSLLIMSSVMLTVFVSLILSIDCESFTSEFVIDKCQSDMNGNMIFVLVTTIPVIIGSAYYLVHMNRESPKFSSVSKN